MINYLISKVFAVTFYLQELVTNSSLEKGEIQNWGKIIKTWLIEQGIAENYANYMKIAIFLIVIALLCFIANFIAKKIILSILAMFIKKSKTEWDDILLEKKVFNRISHFAPAMVIYFLIEPALANNPGWVNTIQSGTYIYMIAAGMMVLISFFNAIGEIYNRLPAAKNRSIKSYLQVVKIFVYFISGILIISILMGKSPGYFLGGLGAMAAILMLVFKDSILGLVGGIQIASNDLLRPGDWISMPSKGADGVVTDISLNTVKVQNWDKTIATIPTYSLVSESFSNWRGMEESGGRRIKRSVIIDISSIKFCDEKMIGKFEKIEVLKEYVSNMKKEQNEYNEKHNIDSSVTVNGRRMTNIGTFRVYLEEYLKGNPNVNTDMTFLIRQLQPTELGLPIQIYVFSKIQAWADYEKVQSDIFDHIFAILPEFELRAFQNPTGGDFKKITNK